jgi:hypothetical protein
VRNLLDVRERRTIGAGATIICVTLLGFRGVPAWRRWEEGTRAAAVELAAADAQARSAAKSLPAVLDSVSARQERLVALAPRVLDGRTAASAGASLAALVSAAAARSGVALGTLEVRADSGAKTFAPVAVNGDATGDLAGITRMLALLEAGPELLVFREIEIVQPDPGGPADRPEALRLEFTVAGLAVAPAPKNPR